MDEDREDSTDNAADRPAARALGSADRGGFPVVGVGASAGGLGALSSLLGELPADPGMAIVVVTHGDPGEESQLTDLLAAATEMDVVEIEEGMAIEENVVHVAPSGQVPGVEDDRLAPVVADEEAISYAIDRFFRSLSATYRAQAVGVVLSGGLADGASGLQAIQQRGGIAIVQDPETAKHESMPRSAIEAGYVDHVLAPAAIADELQRVRDRWASRRDVDALPDDALAEIFTRVRERTGVDFSRYRRSTLVRRIRRRMVATRTVDIASYVELLEEDADEIWRLHDESLIHVTEFLRDPEVFQTLEDEVLPELVDDTDEDPIRIWVPGCATGEELYTLAMVVDEHLAERGLDREIQLFGTDVSERVIEIAREARYPFAIADSVDDERLERHFVEDDGAYRVRERLRDACVFARHDLLNDPPFSEIDIVSCRNMLIYLDRDHQDEVARALHYALGPEGALVLGSSESVHRFPKLFEPWDPDQNIHRPKRGSEGRHPVVSPSLGTVSRGRTDEGGDHGPVEPKDVSREVDRVALDLYAPPAIVLDEDLTVTEFRGDVSDYLDPEEGQASLDLMRIAPRGLAVAIRSAVDEIRETGGPVREAPVRFRRGDERSEVGLQIAPVPPGEPQAGHLMVAFEDPQRTEGRPLFDRVGGLLGDLFEPGPDEDSGRVQELEEELEATRAYLQSVIEDYEATNEELRSAHEEALSTNEELQSTNEELETTKEELQSTNEELNHANDELRKRNEEIEQVNADLVNLLEGVGLPIVMLGAELDIRRFTPQAAELLGLIAADVGRPLADLNIPFDVDLQAEVREVLDTLSVHQTILTDDEGNRYRLRIKPYRTDDDRIDGAVLVFWGEGGGSDPMDSP
jgi:two-component system CheB/CheR fusion protein